MKILLLFLSLGLLCQLSFAQTTPKPAPLAIVNYDDNVKAPLSQKELSQIKEVYAEYTDQYVLEKPQRLKDIKNILRNRVEIKLITNSKEVKPCPLLSQVTLFNNYNKALKRDVGFNPQSFNPLKYNFKFYGLETAMYKVDNTNYYIIIKSQHL